MPFRSAHFLFSTLYLMQLHSSLYAAPHAAPGQ